MDIEVFKESEYLRKSGLDNINIQEECEIVKERLKIMEEV